jgi:hypothetical protein
MPAALRPAKLFPVDPTPREVEPKPRDVELPNRDPAELLEPNDRALELAFKPCEPALLKRELPAAFPPAPRPLPPNECQLPSARAEFVAPPREPPKLPVPRLAPDDDPDRAPPNECQLPSAIAECALLERPAPLLPNPRLPPPNDRALEDGPLDPPPNDPPREPPKLREPPPKLRALPDDPPP